MPCFIEGRPFDDANYLKNIGIDIMKKTSSLKSLKTRDKNNKVVRRRDGKGKMRLYVINKENPRMKAKQ